MPEIAAFGGGHDDKPSNFCGCPTLLQSHKNVQSRHYEMLIPKARLAMAVQLQPVSPTGRTPPILSRYMCMYMSYIYISHYIVISYVIYHISYAYHSFGVNSPALPPLFGLFSLRLHSGLHSLRQTGQWRVHDAAELQLQLGLRGEVHNHCTWRCWRWRHFLVLED